MRKIIFLNEDFDPPYNAQQIKDNYGEKIYQRLIKDPAHRWRMKTGIELIHKEPSKDELERIWANWQLMSDKQKQLSDKKSIQLFGKTNAENYSDLINLYESSNILNENYIFNTDNIEINLNRWKKNGDNLLYITGHGGSGKTTLMKEMAQKYKCEIIEFDTISSALINGYKNLNKNKCHPLCIEYLNKHPLPTNVSWEDIDIFNDECNKFHNWLIKRVKENDCKNSLFILEGQQIFLCLDPELLRDKPIIIMGTSALVSWYRMNKRTSKRKNINGLKKLLLFLSTLQPTYIKKYISDEKKLKELKNLHESVEKEDELVFLSDKNMNGKTLIPRIPDNFLIKNGYEDSVTPRVCFASSIDKALMAISKNLTGEELYVHQPKNINKKAIYKPTVKEVPDVKITGEIWYKEPVVLKCVGKILVTADDGKAGHKYTYGNKTAELYGWDWEWIEN